MNTYDVGDLVRVSGSFSGSDAAALDPTGVWATYRYDGGSSSTVLYTGSTALTKDGTGLYHIDIGASYAGAWYVRLAASGTGQSAAETQFTVRPSAF